MYKSINGKKMSKEQIEMYLQRIGIYETSEPNLSFLQLLHKKHIEAVPYENMDFVMGKPVSINRDELYRKIVKNKRGGVCSEINTLYNWLLESLEYDVRSYISRVISQKQPIQSQGHRIIGVKLNGETYITDVGFNYEHHQVPLLIKEGLVQSDESCEYKLVKDDFFCWLLMQNRPDFGWRNKLGFTEEPHIDLDYVASTFMAELHPSSMFNKQPRVSRYIDGEFHVIRNGCYLRGRFGDEKIIEENLTNNRTKELLLDVFSISIK